MKSVSVQDPQGKALPFRQFTPGLIALLFFSFGILIFISPAAASATNVYIAQSAAGAASGTDCADAYAVTFFNTAANWGSGAAQIGPGTTVHLCGTFTGTAGANMLTVQGSGTSGSPVTVLFESGAVMTAPYWSGANGAIELNSKSYIVVSGGSNGIIENTANGSGFANHQNSIGIDAASTTNCEIKNLSILNIYVHSSASDNAIDQTAMNAIKSYPPSTNLTIDNNTIHDCGWCLDGYGNGYLVSGNNIYNMDHGLAIGLGAGSAGNMTIHDNHIHDYANWDTTTDAYHHDGIHAWGQGGTITSLTIYNNLFDGDMGVNITGHIYLEQAVNDVQIYNNVFLQGAGSNPDNTGIVCYCNYGATTATGGQFYDNTVIGNSTISSGNGNTCVAINQTTSMSVENNVIEGCYTLVSLNASPTFTVLDYNTYQDAGSDFSSTTTLCWNGASFCTTNLATWKSNSGGDAHAQLKTAAQINLSSIGQPLSGSAVIGAGTNLTSLGISALDFDKAGTARPSSGAWDAGAYEFADPPAPNPPANLTASAH